MKENRKDQQTALNGQRIVFELREHCSPSDVADFKTMATDKFSHIIQKIKVVSYEP